MTGKFGYFMNLSSNRDGIGRNASLCIMICAILIFSYVIYQNRDRFGPIRHTINREYEVRIDVDHQITLTVLLPVPITENGSLPPLMDTIEQIDGDATAKFFVENTSFGPMLNITFEGSITVGADQKYQWYGDRMDSNDRQEYSKRFPAMTLSHSNISSNGINDEWYFNSTKGAINTHSFPERLDIPRNDERFNRTIGFSSVWTSVNNISIEIILHHESSYWDPFEKWGGGGGTSWMIVIDNCPGGWITESVKRGDLAIG